LFGLVVAAAEGSQIAQARRAAIVVGHGVVGVALLGRAAAAGENAGGMPDLDKVP
jgi:hypothetical protein